MFKDNKCAIIFVILEVGKNIYKFYMSKAKFN